MGGESASAGPASDSAGPQCRGGWMGRPEAPASGKWFPGEIGLHAAFGQCARAFFLASNQCLLSTSQEGWGESQETMPSSPYVLMEVLIKRIEFWWVVGLDQPRKCNLFRAMSHSRMPCVIQVEPEHDPFHGPCCTPDWHVALHSGAALLWLMKWITAIKCLRTALDDSLYLLNHPFQWNICQWL